MNWTMFFSILLGVPAGLALCIGLVALSQKLDDLLGGHWGLVICCGALIVLMAFGFGRLAA